MEKKVVLAVGAHPDDIEIGCGGTIAKHALLGHDVLALVMTNGEMGGHDFRNNECVNGLIRCSVKRKNIIFGNFPDGGLRDDLRTVSLVEKVIKDANVTTVYTHYPVDRHQDHRNCSNAVSSAARSVPEIFLFQGPSTSAPFEPHYFIELSGHELKAKLSAIGAYKSQLKKGLVNPLAIRMLARIYGISSKVDYAEAFAINHVIRGGKNV